MARPSLRGDVARVLAALVLAAAALTASLAAAADFSARDVLPLGAAVEGVDLGGLHVDPARERLLREIADPLLRPVTVRAGDVERTLEPADFLSLDIDGMLERALRPNRSLTLAGRVRAALTGTRVGGEVPVLKSADPEGLARWVAALAEDVDAPARDATLTVEGVAVRITPSVTGRHTEREEAAEVLAAALMDGRKSVELPVAPVEPEVREDSFGRTVVVCLSERKLYLYDADELEKSYRIAIGAQGYSTPKGWYRIVQKRYMPTWSNPGSAWARGMPRTIPPGPGNPLGTRALNLDAPGIRIHGTSNNASIGTAASHGCLRMHRWDIEELYERVEVGTRVVIVP
ncbi:MAG: L,D-transpeptidase family protein [Coriobacteriia bacterium]|nr:L,D-transpeptidase family protein [Coriobacteriia bacterium]